MFKNRMRRGTFGPKREEVAGCWRRLHNEELHNLYASPDIVGVIKLRGMKWAGCVSCMGEIRNACIVLVGKPEVKRPLGRSRSRWEDVRMDLREI
jgi:hypothetical protein